MKILVGSHFFSPSIGGIETCSLVLAEEFRTAGHRVRIVTTSPSSDPSDDWGFDVLRGPSATELRQSLDWCDVFFQNNISLRTAMQNVLVRRPWFVTTATWLSSDSSSMSAQGALKRWSLRFAHNLYISRAIASHVGYPGPIVNNPYDDKTFRRMPSVPRTQDIVFLGRLVSDKGCDLLIEALSLMKTGQGRDITATIIGDGPDRKQLEEQVIKSGMRPHIRFAGKLSGDCLATELNRHRAIVIPSRWNEPFGIVALEGMACGCVPVVSSGGGLCDATDPHGFVFPNGDIDLLIRAINDALAFASDQGCDYAEHLARFTPRFVASRYLAEFDRVIASCGRNN